MLYEILYMQRKSDQHTNRIPEWLSEWNIDWWTPAHVHDTYFGVIPKDIIQYILIPMIIFMQTHPEEYKVFPGDFLTRNIILYGTCNSMIENVINKLLDPINVENPVILFAPPYGTLNLHLSNMHTKYYITESVLNDLFKFQVNILRQHPKSQRHLILIIDTLTPGFINTFNSDAYNKIIHTGRHYNITNILIESFPGQGQMSINLRMSTRMEIYTDWTILGTSDRMNIYRSVFDNKDHVLIRNNRIQKVYYLNIAR